MPKNSSLSQVGTQGIGVATGSVSREERTSLHTAGNWQTRAVAFDTRNWNALRPTGKHQTCVTQQSMAEIIAIVWGNDEQEANRLANGRLMAAAPAMYDYIKERSQTDERAAEILWCIHGSR